jgi:Fe-Mn family superoxide dismutase
MMGHCGVTAMALGMSGFLSAAHGGSSGGSQTNSEDECKQLPLPYPDDALEPHIDKETMVIHYGKHHAGYVRGLNKALKDLAAARESGDFALIKHLSREVAFHGSGHVLHTLYWANMAAPGGREPAGELLEAIGRSFGRFDRFRSQFSAATNSVEASGWGILAVEPFHGRLVILQAEKHQDLTIWGVWPLLVCDVWEHAYYLRYQNRRDAYIENFLKVINWPEVETRYKVATGALGSSHTV